MKQKQKHGTITVSDEDLADECPEFTNAMKEQRENVQAFRELIAKHGRAKAYVTMYEDFHERVHNEGCSIALLFAAIILAWALEKELPPVEQPPSEQSLTA